jgi:hypothetical protein
MKAIRFCEYGSPDVLKFEDVESLFRMTIKS